MTVRALDDDPYAPPFANAVQILRVVVDDAARALSAKGEAWSAAPIAPGKWSPRQIVGHLIDSAQNNHGRFVRAGFDDALVCPTYDQDRWVEAQRYGGAEMAALVALWRAYNGHIANVMDATGDECRMRPRTPHNLDAIAWRTVPASEPATLDYLMRDYVGHLQHHVRQLFGVSARESSATD